jgi:hypothetical protein
MRLTEALTMAKFKEETQTEAAPLSSRAGRKAAEWVSLARIPQRVSGYAASAVIADVTASLSDEYEAEHRMKSRK